MTTNRRLVLGVVAVFGMAGVSSLILPGLLARGDDPNLPADIAAAKSSIKAEFVRGAHLPLDPEAIRITSAEVLPHRSYIVYLEVPDAGGWRAGAVYGICTTPANLGGTGGFIDGPNDDELTAQRQAAAAADCP